MFRTILVGAAAVILLASGLVHGLWTDRWSDQADLHSAVERMQRLPDRVGAWQGSPVKMEADPKSGLSGVVARRFVNDQTGKAVTLFLACGRAGPVCVHTPDVCYAGNGYQIDSRARFQLTSDSARTPPEFWTARFVKERADQRTNLRIFWAWHGEKDWQIADNPRLTFASEPVLHKMYVIREMATPNDPVEGDPAVDFLRELLPALDRSVFQRDQ